MAVQSSTRKWVFIGGGVIAAAALVVLFQNYPPQPKDAAGTIGAAQRYHEPQITGADVVVSQDALTTWIQSDTFDRIVKDPQARKLFSDGAAMSAMIADASLKFKLQAAPTDQALVLAENDAVKLGRFIAAEDRARVEVVLSADEAHRLEAVMDASSARTLKEATAGSQDQMRTYRFLVAPDLAFKLNEFKNSDAARLQLNENKGDQVRKSIQFTPDEMLRLAYGAQDYAVKMSYADPNSSAMRLQKVELAGDNAYRLISFLGPDAALKFKLLEATGADGMRRVELNLPADAAKRLEAALGATDNARLEIALGPDAVRQVAAAVDQQFARVEALSLNSDQMRLMNVAFSNEALCAMFHNVDFVRAFSSNPDLAAGLVARTRSEYVESN